LIFDAIVFSVRIVPVFRQLIENRIRGFMSEFCLFTKTKGLVGPEITSRPIHMAR